MIAGAVIGTCAALLLAAIWTIMQGVSVASVIFLILAALVVVFYFCVRKVRTSPVSLYDDLRSFLLIYNFVVFDTSPPPFLRSTSNSPRPSWLPVDDLCRNSTARCTWRIRQRSSRYAVYLCGEYILFKVLLYMFRPLTNEPLRWSGWCSSASRSEPCCLRSAMTTRAPLAPWFVRFLFIYQK